MIKRVLGVVLAVLMLSSVATAEKVAGVDLADSLKAGETELMLNGAGMRTKLFLKLYVGGLYLKAKQQDAAAIMNADEPMALRLHIVSGLVSQEKMLAATSEGFEKATGGNTAPLQDKIAQYNACFSDAITEGDMYDMIYVPGQGVNVLKNNQPKGTIAGLDFKKAMFGIWLCDDPADEDLKEGMLGL
jgi:hypothetical protein